MSKISNLLGSIQETVQRSKNFVDDVANRVAKVNKKLEASDQPTSEFYYAIKSVFGVNLWSGSRLDIANFYKSFTPLKIQVGDIDIENTNQIRLVIPDGGFTLTPEMMTVLSRYGVKVAFYDNGSSGLIVNVFI